MSTFGQILRDAREARGLSTSQVAAKTHILVQIIEGMEKEDFHRIPAAIYGRGFVKSYAACVGLDPQPLLREFMDIYEGRRAPTVQIRPVPTAEPPAPPPTPTPPPPEPSPLWNPPAPEPVPAYPEPAPIPEPAPAFPEPAPVPEPVPAFPEPAPVPEPVPIPEPVPAFPEPAPVPEPAPAFPEPAPVRDPPLSEPEAEPPVQESAPQPIPPPVEDPPSVVRGLDLFENALTHPAPASGPVAQPAPREPEPLAAAKFLPSGYEDNQPSAAERFRRNLSSVSDGVLKSVRRIPRSTWRIALLACAALGVVSLLVYGCVKLYQATSRIPLDPACPDGVCEVDLKAAPAKPAEVTAKPVPAAVQPAPKGPVKLRSTGPKVPTLYVD